MFFVVRSNNSFSFPLGLIKDIIIVIVIVEFATVTLTMISSLRVYLFPSSTMVGTTRALACRGAVPFSQVMVGLGLAVHWHTMTMFLPLASCDTFGFSVKVGAMPPGLGALSPPGRFNQKHWGNLKDSILNTEGTIKDSILNTEGTFKDSIKSTEGTFKDAILNTEGTFKDSIKSTEGTFKD